METNPTCCECPPQKKKLVNLPEQRASLSTRFTHLHTLFWLSLHLLQTLWTAPPSVPRSALQLKDPRQGQQELSCLRVARASGRHEGVKRPRRAARLGDQALALHVRLKKSWQQSTLQLLSASCGSGKATVGLVGEKQKRKFSVG